MAKVITVFSGLSDGNMDKRFGSDVFSNQKRFLKKSGIDINRTALTEVSHGNKITLVTGVSGYRKIFTDGLLTFRKNVFLAFTSADCLPIIYSFYDGEGKLFGVGLVHASRKNTMEGIAPAMVYYTMSYLSFYRLEAKRIEISFGPHIGPCCYEFDYDFLTEEERKLPTFRTGKKGKSIGLIGENIRQLKEISDIGETEIIISSREYHQLCTCCSRIEDMYLFFSHHRSQIIDEPEGRNLVVVGITE